MTPLKMPPDFSVFHRPQSAAGSLIAACSLALAVIASGCLSKAHSGDAGGDMAAAIQARNSALDPQLVPLFSALDEAVRDDNRPLARRLLMQLDAQKMGPGERAAGDRLVLILDGRDVQDSLVLQLKSRALPEREGEREVFLSAHHSWPEPLTLDLPPALVIRTLRAISPEGAEVVTADQVLTEVSLRLELPVAESVELVLGHYPVRFSGALAVEERLSCSTRDGTAILGSRHLPLHDLTVIKGLKTLLPSSFPNGALDEGPLMDLVTRPGLLDQEQSAYLPALLERTVRIAPARRELALLELSRFAQGLDDEQLMAISPALRWLSKVEEEVPSPIGWRSLLVQFIAAGEAAQAPSKGIEAVPGLVLPRGNS